jgi:histidine triad (HIT) family protein
MSSLFSKIIQKEIPAYIVAEDEQNLAFLDIYPLAMGHVLCVPKKETDYIFDLPEADFVSLHAFSAKVAKALKEVVPCTRIGVAVIGLEVPHAHIHLVPIQSVQDINFSKPKLSPEKLELMEMTEKIQQSYKALWG